MTDWESDESDFFFNSRGNYLKEVKDIRGLEKIPLLKAAVFSGET